MCSEPHAQNVHCPLGREKQDGAKPAASQSGLVNSPLDVPVWLHWSRGGSVYTDWLILILLGDGDDNAGLC
jgi:hypothetical protein